MDRSIERTWAINWERPARAVATLLVVVLAALVSLTGDAAGGIELVGSTGTVARASAGTDGVSVAVQGNHLVDGAGHPMRLLGVDRSGTEYACAQGWGIFDGPSDAASVAAIASWHVNAARLLLNEDCWLGINGISPAVGGAAYRTAIESYVHELNQAGVVAILDLHWGAPGGEVALGQEMMPDNHAPAFWQSVASAFASDSGVLFDLFNEPHDVSWSCWLNGCQIPGGYQAVGMQELVDAVRATGATQPIMVEPLGWGGDLSGFLANAPDDPDHQLVASVHLYSPSGCNTPGCWNSAIAPVAAVYPVATGELGEYDCGSSFIDSYMSWADAHGVSYLAWTWDAGSGWSCSSGPALLDNYSGTPNNYGAGFQSHLASLATAHTSYSLSESWGNGGIGELTLTNTGTRWMGSASNPWTVRFSLPTSISVSGMWNAAIGWQRDGVVTATAPSYTPALAPGQSITIGYVFGGGIGEPSQIEVDGMPTGP